MENTLIFMPNLQHPIISELSTEENQHLRLAGMLDIITEICRLAECEPEMKVLICHNNPDKDQFWQEFYQKAEAAQLPIDRHLTNYIKKKVDYLFLPQTLSNDYINEILRAEAEEEQTENVVFINDNCPMLIGEMLDDAFYYLQAADLVLGKTKKNVLYLIGFHEVDERVFGQIDWNQSEILPVLEKAAAKTGQEVKSLDLLATLTQYGDLEKLYQTLSQNGFAPNTKKVLERLLTKN